MRRFVLGVLLLAISLSISACGAPSTQTKQSVTATSPSAVAVAPASTAAAMPATAASATDAPPVTAMMAQLKLAGEPYATVGDPSAPLTVVEFSDYG